MAYDKQNIFAKILRGEIPNKTVYEDEYVLAFHDISPKAPVHILVIPKGAYTDVADFSLNASADEISGFWASFGKIIQQENLHGDGFRVIANTGIHGCQEVPHFHIHILGGQILGSLLVA
jgi:histidine triad (HIT) family protein